MTNQLPQGWVETALGEYLFLKNGFAFKSKSYVPKAINTVPIIRISDIDGKLASDAKASHVAEDNKAEGFEVLKGDLLIAMSGATTGKVGVYNGAEPAYQNQRVGNLKLHSAKHGSEGFRNYLISSLSDDILKVAYGGAQPNISGKAIEQLNIPLPPLAEQKEIARRLDDLLAQVEATKQRLDNIPNILKKFRQSVLAAAVSGKLTKSFRQENGCEQPAKSSLNKLGKITGGKTPSKSNPLFWENGSIPWISPKDMKVTAISSSMDLITELALSEGGMKLIPQNSILMVTRSGILSHSFPVALTQKEVTINQDIKAFIPNKELIISEFASVLLRGLSSRILRECSKAGTTVSSVETKMLEALEFDLPPLDEQKEIVRIVEELFAYADQVEARVNEARKRVDNLTQSTLAKAFRGDLTAEWRAANPTLITGNNSAAALLEKIKESKKAAKPKKKRTVKKKG